MTGSRYLRVLGTSSQAPTRERAGGGYALRWDDQLVLFDPAEGFQRQCLVAKVPIGRATAVCITHFHGDHCLGLPGIVQRRALSQSKTALPVYFPAEGLRYFNNLLESSIYDEDVIEPRPVEGTGVIGSLGSSELISERLDHRVPTIGFRVQEPDRLRLDATRLDELDVRGRDVGRLARDGEVTVGGRRVMRSAVSALRHGQSMAFVMDTVLCDGAFELATNADLLVCEATYLERDRHVAEQGRHLTARQAGELAVEAGVRRLVLTHFSGRYEDVGELRLEAAQVFDDVVAAEDLGIVHVPARRPRSSRHAEPGIPFE